MQEFTNFNVFIVSFIMEKLQYNNIFDVITDDPAEAADLEFRADMMLLLRNYFQSKSWSQTDIMKTLGITQPRVSELTRGKIDKFSADKLIRFLAKIGYKIKPSCTVGGTKTLKIECLVKELIID